MSSMSLQTTAEALAILGSLNSHSNTSFVAISPMSTSDAATIKHTPVEGNETRKCSSTEGMYPWCNHLASSK